MFTYVVNFGEHLGCDAVFNHADLNLSEGNFGMDREDVSRFTDSDFAQDPLG
jgi:hypothetical protein